MYCTTWLAALSYRMTFDDFCRYFVSLAVCQRVNTSPLSLDKTWNELMIHGEWALPHRVGGCINNKRTFLSNPQVRMLRRRIQFMKFRLVFLGLCWVPVGG